MRKYLMVLTAAVCLAPQAAFACSSLHQSSISVSCEKGVKVYRGTPLGNPVITAKPTPSRSSVQVFAAQQALIKSQSARINALEDDLAQANRPTASRGRYNRSFGVPIGAFGRGVGSGFGGRIAPRLGSRVSFGRSRAFGRRRF